MQSLLIVVIALLFCGLSYLVWRWPGGLHMTFSQHAAAKPSSQLYYASLFLVTLPLLGWYFLSWLVPTYELPRLFVWLAAVAMVFQIMCTLFPEVGGKRTVIHRILSGISGVAMVPLVGLLVLSPNVSFLARSTAATMGIIMFVILGVALRHQKGYRWALLIQVVYYSAFFTALMAATFV